MLDRRILALVLSIGVFSGARALAAEPAVGEKATAADATSADEASATPSEGEATADASEAEDESGAEGPGLFEQSLSGGDGSSTAVEGGVAGLSLNGYVRGDAFIGRVPDARQADLKAAYGELALVARTEKGSRGDGYAEARIHYGLQGDQRMSTVDLREAYVNLYLGRLDLRVGKQIIVWGRADLFNPTNNLTANDMRVRSPIEDDRRVGNVGVRANWRLAPIRVEGVWMPSYVATELPTVSMPQYVSFGTPVYPSPSHQNWLEALRVHLEMPSFEMSVSYLYGYSVLPGLTLTSLTLSENPSVVIARTAYKHHVAGFDFSTTLADYLGVRLEAAYRRPVDYQNLINAPVPDAQYAIGLDHTFGSVMVIVQYLGRYAFDWEKKRGPSADLDPGQLVVDDPDLIESQTPTFRKTINSELSRINQMIFNQTEQIQHLITARVEWLTLHEALSLSAVGMVNASTKEWLLMPKLGFHISDQIMTYVGAEVGSGPHGTLLGLVDKTMSAGYVELRSTF